MSKAFLWFGFLASIFFLFLQLTSSSVKIYFVAFWALILIGCSYKLFLAKPTTASSTR